MLRVEGDAGKTRAGLACSFELLCRAPVKEQGLARLQWAHLPVSTSATRDAQLETEASVRELEEELKLEKEERCP